MEKEKENGKKGKEKKKKKKRRERGKERFAANLSAATPTPVGLVQRSRPRAAALAGSGVRKIEGNRGTEWRVDPGVGTGERFSGVRVLVLRGFELNDEFFLKKIYF